MRSKYYLSVLKYYWVLWARALGKKAHDNDWQADKIAMIRTAIVLCYIITNCFIIAGVIHHW